MIALQILILRYILATEMDEMTSEKQSILNTTNDDGVIINPVTRVSTDESDSDDNPSQNDDSNDKGKRSGNDDEDGSELESEDVSDSEGKLKSTALLEETDEENESGDTYYNNYIIRMIMYLYAYIIGLLTTQESDMVKSAELDSANDEMLVGSGEEESDESIQKESSTEYNDESESEGIPESEKEALIAVKTSEKSKSEEKKLLVDLNEKLRPEGRTVRDIINKITRKSGNTKNGGNLSKDEELSNSHGEINVDATLLSKSDLNEKLTSVKNDGITSEVKSVEEVVEKSDKSNGLVSNNAADVGERSKEEVSDNNESIKQKKLSVNVGNDDQTSESANAQSPDLRRRNLNRPS